MRDPFASPRLTILRAQHHINDLNSRINGFVSSQPWSYAIEKNANHTLDLHKIKFARRLDADLPCVVFDASNNLRAALDQAGYAAALLGGKIEPKSSNFPFGDDEDGLKSVIGRGKCKDLPPEILSLFRAFKPYKGGNTTLWALNKLCNSKKHCGLIPFAIGHATIALSVGKTETSVEYHPGFRRISVSGNVGFFGGPMSVKSPQWDPEKYEITLVSTPANSTTNHQPNVTLNVTLDGIEALRSKPAVAVLNEMMRVVDGILSATEAKCRRLGLIK